MEQSPEIKQLLTEIRDTQREHLEEYRRVADESLALQSRAVDRQQRLGRLYQGALIVAAVLTIGIVLLIMYLMSYLP